MDEIKGAGKTKGVQDSGSMSVSMVNDGNVDVYVSSGARDGDDWSYFNSVDKLLVKPGQSVTIADASMGYFTSTSYWWFQVGYDTSLHPNAGEDVRCTSPAASPYNNETTRFYSNAMAVALTPVLRDDDGAKGGVGSSYGFTVRVSQP